MLSSPHPHITDLTDSSEGFTSTDTLRDLMLENGLEASKVEQVVLLDGAVDAPLNCRMRASRKKHLKSMHPYSIELCLEGVPISDISGPKYSMGGFPKIGDPTIVH